MSEYIVVRSQGTNTIGKKGALVYYNDKPFAIRTKHKGEKIFLCLTDRIHKSKSRSLGYYVPLMVLKYFIEVDTMRRIVFQSSGPDAWYWLCIGNIDKLKMNKQGEVFVGLQHFEVDSKPPPIITARKAKCLASK